MYNGNGESQRYLLCLNCVPIFQLLSRPKPKHPSKQNSHSKATNSYFTTFVTSTLRGMLKEVNIHETQYALLNFQHTFRDFPNQSDKKRKHRLINHWPTFTLI